MDVFNHWIHTTVAAPAFAIPVLALYLLIQALIMIYSSHRYLVLWRWWRVRRVPRAARPPAPEVFDADFVPPADVLTRMLPHFAKPDVGMAQARWGHLNRDRSLLTEAQAVMLDAHFMLEHQVRMRCGLFFNFNGTAGIWRRQCIEEAGGWSADTLTEDLDLSYRAQLGSWPGTLVQIAVLVSGVVPLVLFLIVGQRAAGGRNAWQIACGTLAAMVLGVGLSVNNARAALRAFGGVAADWERTPKTGDRMSRPIAALGNSPSPSGWTEVVVAGYCAGLAVVAASVGQMQALPFMLMLTLGFCGVGWAGAGRKPALRVLESGALRAGRSSSRRDP